MLLCVGEQRLTYGQFCVIVETVVGFVCVGSFSGFWGSWHHVGKDVTAVNDTAEVDAQWLE